MVLKKIKFYYRGVTIGLYVMESRFYFLILLSDVLRKWFISLLHSSVA